MKLTTQQKQANLEARREKRKQEKETARIEAEKNQKPVKRLKIQIEWKRSRTWGNNPHAEVWVDFEDGDSTYRNGYTASGCGYDKESTVIAEIFNDFLKYKLYTDIDGEVPYGMYYRRPDNDWKSYNGGVGVNCYYAISEFIGGKFECVASGKSFDVYTYTANEKMEGAK